MSIWIINGRCESCVRRELADEYCGDVGCDCWCHDRNGEDAADDDDW